MILEYLSDLNVTKPEFVELNIGDIGEDHIGDLVLMEGNITYIERNGYLIIKVNDSTGQIEYRIFPSVADNLSINSDGLFTHIKCQGVVRKFNGNLEIVAREIEDVDL